MQQRGGAGRRGDGARWLKAGPVLAPLILAMTLAVRACGFTPVHAPAADAGAGASAPASVAVAPIPDRLGQILRSELAGRLDPGGQRETRAYRLDVSLDESVRETGFRLDETATRRNIRLTARYRLLRQGSEETVLEGEVQTTNSANILDQPYATEVAERDARERGARDLAAKIARHVSSSLTSSHSDP